MISVNGFKFEGPITSFEELRDEEVLYAFFISDGEQAEVIRFGQDLCMQSYARAGVRTRAWLVVH